MMKSAKGGIKRFREESTMKKALSIILSLRQTWSTVCPPTFGCSVRSPTKGAMVEWLFSTMCGIRVEVENHFTIAPKPGGRFTHAAAFYTSVFGRVESKWERKDGRTTYMITVPANCEATILLPSGRTETVGAGQYRYTEA